MSVNSLVRQAPALAALVLLMAVPVATWWLAGDQSTVPVSAAPDYFIKPFNAGPQAERAAGTAALLVCLVTLSMVAWVTARRRVDPRWWGVLVPLLIAGFLVGSGWRVLTAGVIGANIGVGFVIMLGGPTCAVLLLWALTNAIHLLRRQAKP